MEKTNAQVALECAINAYGSSAARQYTSALLTLADQYKAWLDRNNPVSTTK